MDLPETCHAGLWLSLCPSAGHELPFHHGPLGIGIKAAFAPLLLHSSPGWKSVLFIAHTSCLCTLVLIVQVLKDGLIRSATAHQDNQLRYFNSSEASELLSLPEEGFTSDKTLRMMEEKHKGEVHL